MSSGALESLKRKTLKNEESEEESESDSDTEESAEFSDSWIASGEESTSGFGKKPRLEKETSGSSGLVRQAPHVSALSSRLRQEQMRLAQALHPTQQDAFLAATLDMIREPEIDHEEADAIEITSWEDAMMGSMGEAFHRFGGLQ